MQSSGDSSSFRVPPEYRVRAENETAVCSPNNQQQRHVGYGSYAMAYLASAADWFSCETMYLVQTPHIQHPHTHRPCVQRSTDKASQSLIVGLNTHS